MFPGAVPAWLAGTVMYQIYPQSFADSDGDGIGDLRGITDRLDYLAWLGVDSLWLNPCFASPFRDAGYDVSDYLSIAPRYGSKADLLALVGSARGRGIRVLLDLVPGHTSDRHPWFLAACDDPADGRYIFAAPGEPAESGEPGEPAESGEPGEPADLSQPVRQPGPAGPPGPQWVASPGRRPGWYLPNFFPFQPALNYGYARMNPAEPWRQPAGAPGPRANRAALAGIMRHWLDLGVAGFRVDLAGPLVKDAPGWRETGRLWREIRGWLDSAFPDAVLMSEWNSPAVAIAAGFHADFYLAVGPEYRSLLDNGAGLRVPGTAPGPCYFSADGSGSPEPFLAAWRRDSSAPGSGVIALFSSDHDFARRACGPRTADQLGPVFAFLLTWPALPGIHCGDEIGMRYIPDLPDKEGSQIWPGWNRAGSRTPMQWDEGPGSGFSRAPARALYLPVDPDPGRPTVAAQRADGGSLLRQVRRLIAVRKEIPALRTGAAVSVLNAGYPLVYTRGGSHLVVINPGRDPVSFALPSAGSRGERGGSGTLVPVLVHGVTAECGQIRAGGFGYGIFVLSGA